MSTRRPGRPKGSKNKGPRSDAKGIVLTTLIRLRAKHQQADGKINADDVIREAFETFEEKSPNNPYMLGLDAIRDLYYRHWPKGTKAKTRSKTVAERVEREKEELELAHAAARILKIGSIRISQGMLQLA